MRGLRQRGCNSSSLCSLLTRSPACPYYPGQVTSFSKEGHGLWGFTVSFLKDGVSAADVRVSFDEEVTHKHEWVGRAAGLLPSEHLTPPLLLLLPPAGTLVSDDVL